MEDEATLLTSPCLDDSSKQPLSASQLFFVRKWGRLGKLGIQGFDFTVDVFKYHKDPQGMLAGRGKMQLSGPDNEAEFPFPTFFGLLNVPPPTNSASYRFKGKC